MRADCCRDGSEQWRALIGRAFARRHQSRHVAEDQVVVNKDVVIERQRPAAKARGVNCIYPGT